MAQSAVEEERTWEYEGLEYIQYQPPTQHVLPVQLVPPHCAYCERCDLQRQHADLTKKEPKITNVQEPKGLHNRDWDNWWHHIEHTGHGARRVSKIESMKGFFSWVTHPRIVVVLL